MKFWPLYIGIMVLVEGALHVLFSSEISAVGVPGPSSPAPIRASRPA